MFGGACLTLKAVALFLLINLVFIWVIHCSLGKLSLYNLLSWPAAPSLWRKPDKSLQPQPVQPRGDVCFTQLGLEAKSGG